MSESNEWILAVGSTRKPKLRAVESAVALLRARFPTFLPGELSVIAMKVDSGTPDTPRTTEEMMVGARVRARNALAALSPSSSQAGRALAVGLEGGVRTPNPNSEDDGGTYLEAWSYVTDGARGAHGSSGAIPLPAGLAIPVAAGADLGESADAFFGRTGVAGGEGTFGVLTARLVSREDAFVRSLIHALAPFYNLDAYAGRSVARPPEPGADPSKVEI